MGTGEGFFSDNSSNKLFLEHLGALKRAFQNIQLIAVQRSSEVVVVVVLVLVAVLLLLLVVVTAVLLLRDVVEWSRGWNCGVLIVPKL